MLEVELVLNSNEPMGGGVSPKIDNGHFVIDLNTVSLGSILGLLRINVRPSGSHAQTISRDIWRSNFAY